MTLRSQGSVGSGRRPYPAAEYLKRNGTLIGSNPTAVRPTSEGCPIVCSSSHQFRGKMIAVKVLMLDDSQTIFQIQERAPGRLLFQQVCRQLNLLEEDYFGLEYEDLEHRTKYWLDLDKPMNHQLGVRSLADVVLSFVIKFYTPDPGQIEEEYTRFLFCLQIKRDLYRGDLLVNDNTAAVLSSYIVQASCGDYAPEDYPDSSYLSSYKFVPQQDPDVERKIMEYHRRHIGQCPGDADRNLLETARRCEYYGVKLNPVRLHAKGVKGVPCFLSVAYNGITVYQNQTRINTFTWAKMRKISFKRRRFLIKLYREAAKSTVIQSLTAGSTSSAISSNRDMVEFLFPLRDDAKNFWKKCVENHAFFRCPRGDPDRAKRSKKKPVVFSRGSSFRYSGRTQQEMLDYVRENFVSRQSFKAPGGSASLRSHSGSPIGGGNSSISAHPLLPVGNMGSPSADSRLGMDSSMDSGSLRISRHHHPLQTSSRIELYRQSQSLPETPVKGGGIVSVADSSGSASGTTSVAFNVAIRRSFGPIGEGGIRTSNSTPVSSSAGFHSAGLLASTPRRAPTPPPPYQPPRNSFRGGDSDPMKVLQDMIDSDRYLHHQQRPTSMEIRPQVVEEMRYYSPHEAPTSPTTDDGGGKYSSEGAGTLSPLSEAISCSSPVAVPSSSVSTSTAGQHGRGQENTFMEHVQIQSSSDDLMTSGGSRKRLGSHSLHINDASYFMAKELLMSERTFKKDLEVLTIAFRGEIEDSDEFCQHSVLCAIFDNLDPLVAFHSALLREMERRISQWNAESAGNNMMGNGGDTLLCAASSLAIERSLTENLAILISLHRSYLSVHYDLITDLEDLLITSKTFESLWRKFDSAKVCYLPLNHLLMKPLHRILHYELLLDRLARHYEETDTGGDASEVCWRAVRELRALTSEMEEAMPMTLNLIKIAELRRECEGFDELFKMTGATQRWFLREGALLKWSRYGYSQRLFFLFSDVLVYVNRLRPTSSGESPNQFAFKVHGTLPLVGLAVEAASPGADDENVFTLYGTTRTLKLQATSLGDRIRWVRDLENAIADAESRGDGQEFLQLSASGAPGVFHSMMRSSVSQEEVTSGEHGPAFSTALAPSPRSNTSLHVCWHRTTTMNYLDQKLSLQVHLSGYLLRKFKNSAGWQKLWVVFTNFCLFFYKNWQDSIPLASLPLLGYAVAPASLEDNINKELVLKLSYKSHVYFFRAESAFTFGRWLEVLSLVADEEMVSS